VEKLLADERYPLHWANVWRSWVVPDTNDLRLSSTPGAFEGWIVEELKRNTPYDRIVSALLSNGGNPGSQVFLHVHQGQPENLASATARLFLGVKLECAQCHNHPFAKWKRQQFWEFAAFFSATGIRWRGSGPPPPSAAGTILIAGTDKMVKARMPDGTSP